MRPLDWEKDRRRTIKWKNRSDADKQRIEKWVKRNARIRRAEEREKRRLERLEKRRAIDAKERNPTIYYDKVSVINWVEDTPKSLAIQFCRWRNAKR
jgi:hypothetical protein